MPPAQAGEGSQGFHKLGRNSAPSLFLLKGQQGLLKHNQDIRFAYCNHFLKIYKGSYDNKKMPTKQQVVEVLKTCLDPEIGIDIWTLELIYDIKLDGKKVHVKMTFTSPMCPYGPVLVEEVKRKVGELDGVENVDVEVVFDPPWEPSDELKATLGIGV